MQKRIISVLVVLTMIVGMRAMCLAQQEPAGQVQKPAMQTDEPAMKAEEPAAPAEEPAGEMQEASQLEVSVAAICRDVVDLEPVDAGVTFAATVGKLYCFTKITGAESPTHITHVWYFDGTERARVDLAVNSVSWRTYSSKIIQQHEQGAWRVDILDAEGDVLKSLEFQVTP